MDFLEKDLFLPVSDYFKEQGYDVYGEVNGCDLVARNAEESIVVELKKAFNLKLVYQAVDRQEFSNIVYVAIGRSQKGMRDSNFKSMVKLLKRLDIGLITVAVDSPVKTVEVIVEPNAVKAKNSKKKAGLKNELNGRSENFNKGGINKTTIITAYRERSIELLCLIEKLGIVTNKLLKELNYDTKMAGILYKNYYGWFKKVNKAEYTISERGEFALKEEKYLKLIKAYRKNLEEKMLKLNI